MTEDLLNYCEFFCIRRRTQALFVELLERTRGKFGKDKKVKRNSIGAFVLHALLNQETTKENKGVRKVSKEEGKVYSKHVTTTGMDDKSE